MLITIQLTLYDRNSPADYPGQPINPYVRTWRKILRFGFLGSFADRVFFNRSISLSIQKSNIPHIRNYCRITTSGVASNNNELVEGNVSVANITFPTSVINLQSD